MPALWGAGIALVGAGVQAYSANEAGNEMSDAAGQAGKLTDAQYRQSRADMAAGRSVGAPATYSLANLLGITPQRLNANDAYLARRPDVAATPWGGQAAQHFQIHGQGEGTQWGEETDAELQARTGFGAGGNAATGSLMRDFTGADVATDPGYQFGQQQGELGINRGAARSGMRLAPATMKALLKFNQDYAGTKFGDAFNRDQVNKTGKFNMLSGVAGSGQMATAQTAQLGAHAAGQSADYMTQGGNARAAGIMGQANAFTSGLGSIYNNYNQTQSMKQFMDNQTAHQNGYNPQTGLSTRY